MFIPYNPYLWGSYISIKLLKLFEEYLKNCIFYSTHSSTIGTYIPYMKRDLIYAKLAVHTSFIFNILFFILLWVKSCLMTCMTVWYSKQTTRTVNASEEYKIKEICKRLKVRSGGGGGGVQELCIFGDTMFIRED